MNANSLLMCYSYVRAEPIALSQRYNKTPVKITIAIPK